MSTDSTSTTTTYGTISKSFNGTSNPKPNGKSEISPIIENRPKNNKSKIRNKSYPQRNDRVEITKFNSNPSTPISKSSMIFAQLIASALLLSWLLQVDTILKDLGSRRWNWKFRENFFFKSNLELLLQTSYSFGLKLSTSYSGWDLASPQP